MESKIQDRHKIVVCDVCNKCMRSDNLKRHKQTHKDIFSLTDEEIKEELKARQEVNKKQQVKLQRIEDIAKENDLVVPEEVIRRKRKSVDKIDDVRARCLQNHQLYLEKIELGKQIATIIENGEVIYESLGRSDKEAFDTYRKYLKVDISNVELRKWQEDAMKFFNSPTQRQVIWITDQSGGKGKTFFQKYVVGYFGRSRVVTLDLRVKHANACNILKKLPLATIDIFLFNDVRSQYGEDLNVYKLLEDIKDGQATTSKYDNDNIQFKTPNTVMIFSNEYPNLNRLTNDRWLVLHPNNDGLLNFTDKLRMRKQQKITVKAKEKSKEEKYGSKLEWIDSESDEEFNHWEY